MKEGRIIEDGQPQQLIGEYVALKMDYKKSVEKQEEELQRKE